MFPRAAWLLVLAPAGCLASSRPVPTGPRYQLIPVALNGRAVVAARPNEPDTCALLVGEQRVVFRFARAGTPPGPAPALFLAESELRHGVALRCDAWSPPLQLGIIGPARRAPPLYDRADQRVLARAVSAEELSQGHLVIEGNAPTSGGVSSSPVRLQLRLLPAP